MKSILISADTSKAIELFDIPMIDGYVQVCNTMNWIFSDTIEISINGIKYFLVCDDLGIVNHSKLNLRATKLCTISYSTYYPIFGDVLLFGKCLNEFDEFDYCSCDEDSLIFIRGILNE